MISYNQATTKLAFHSNETSKDKLNIKLVIYYCHLGACQTTQKTCSFLHAHYTET